ncbi:c-type cytochrome [Acidovorax sp. Be4]|uniref:C-type cytochrome n=1 Tax=Acidovorax bellezanensis TaxID=2976702 RepID=A0ABT2PNF4_9BURK|nr:c-type cytochrome [Acidovorax sp. Be4]MCT9810742.1 c-type cytochrome [Acidovorax sp. Be4]
MKHLLLLSLWTTVGTLAAQAAEPAPRDRLERGRYLVNTSGCADCHTPMKMGPRGPEPDAMRSLSGHPEGLVMPPVPTLPVGPWLVISSATNTAWAGPWGVSFTANLTPDPETGLGRWSEQNFVQTLRKGRHMGAGRPLLPPMPAAFGQMTDADLSAIFTYLKTVPPVRNRVPVPLPPGTR